MNTPNRPNDSLRWILLAKAGAGLALVLALAAGYWLQAHGFTAGEYLNELGRPSSEPRYEWRSVDKKHWQALTSVAGEPVSMTDARENNGAGCRSGMVRVKGNYRNENRGEPTGEIERIQDAACTDWISKDFPARCRTFDPTKIASDIARIPTKSMDFCMDRFEYPNALGQNPIIVSTFHEAEAMCKASSKRLCNESEWTFACEGEEVRPYPYGYTRDATACVMDRSWRPFKEGALQPRDGDGARAELDRLWQGEPSGSRASCRSPFGVYDMTGNVDEWTRTSKTKGYASVLKGGYWGPVRARCRPATRAHNEDFIDYQEGFRCCDAANGAVEAPRPTPPIAQADAGTSTPAALAPARDGGAPLADLSPEWESPADGDEGQAISRARVGLACDVASGPGSRGSSPAGLALAALATLALVLRERHGRRAPPAERAEGAPVGRSPRRAR